MIRHAENVNLGGDRQNDPLKNAIFAKVSRQSSNLDNFQVEEPQDLLNMARTSNLSGKGVYSLNDSSEQSQRQSQSAQLSLKSQGSMSYVQTAYRGSLDLQMILDASESPSDVIGSNSPVKQKLPPKPMIMMQQRMSQKSPVSASVVVKHNEGEDELDILETENARQSQHVQRQKPSLSNLQRLISPGSKDGGTVVKARKRA